MFAFSATDAIAPAVERTRQLLFRPFQFGTFLKLCTVAILTGGGGSSGNFNSWSHHNHPATSTTTSTYSQMGTGMPHLPFNPAWILAAFAFLLFVFVLASWIFYLIVRLRFAFFDCLIHQTRLIRPGWHKYRFQAFRYFLLCIVVGLVFFGVMALIALPFIFGFLRLYHENQLSGQFPVAGFLALVLPLVPILILLVLAGIAVNIILRDFMLPHMALENASAGQAWAVVRAHIAAEKGPFLLYAVLRIFAPIAVTIGLFMVLIIPGVILFGGMAASLAGLHVLFANLPAALKVVGIILQGLVGLVIVATALLLLVCFGGPINIAFLNYALVFYGGRYPTLGEILYPTPPPAPLPQPGIA